MTTSPRSAGVSHVRALLLVFVGGAVGTGAREALSLGFPAAAGTVPVTILLINVSGAFLLGVLLEAVALSGPDRGSRRDLRLLVGTGVLGGFTTYSAFAADTAVLLGLAPAIGVLYVGATLVLGLAAAGAGIALVGAVRRGRGREDGVAS